MLLIDLRNNWACRIAYIKMLSGEAHSDTVSTTRFDLQVIKLAPLPGSNLVLNDPYSYAFAVRLAWWLTRPHTCLKIRGLGINTTFLNDIIHLKT